MLVASGASVRADVINARWDCEIRRHRSNSDASVELPRGANDVSEARGYRYPLAAAAVVERCVIGLLD